MSRRSLTVALSLLIAVIVAACGGAASPPRPPEPAPIVPPAPAVVAVAGAPTRGAAAAPVPEAGTKIPVTSADPQLGSPLAPVTLVVFADLQCPFCARLEVTLSELSIRYGRERLRIVWKDNPLPFHPNARPAALAAETVFHLGGDAAFFAFVDRAFGEQRDLSPERFAEWAVDSGVDRTAFQRSFDARAYDAMIDTDMALAKALGATGTPASFVNGVYVSGAQPIDKFVAVIDRALQEAGDEARAGTPADRIYAVLSDRNFAAPKPPPPAAAEDEADDATVWRVPVAGSPVRGGKDAPVTVVVFADFQCPFCGRVQGTLEQLGQRYGEKVRFVWKDQPLPFHQHAEPAAELAREARAQRGDSGFWAAHDKLFAHQMALEETDLLGYAKELGLDVARVKTAIETKKHKAAIEADQDLAEDVQASGTPHFFVNGRRLVGAQPVEKFQKLIDEELATAAKLAAGGTPARGVYEARQRGAKSGAPIERIVVPDRGDKSPGKGAKVGAPVVIQMFADLECPFCRRAEPVIDELIAAYPGKIRVVFRHMPLPMHQDAEPAAEAAMEAYAQKGDAGFWKMTDLLFEAQETGLDWAAIERAASAAGLDMVKFRAAMTSHKHKAAIDADKALADKLGITGTPSFAINDYYLSGAQPIAKFKRLVGARARAA